MDLRYRTTTINYCLDLTDPVSEVVPVAVFVAAVFGESSRMAALATRLDHPLRPHIDPVAQELLDVLPQLLLQQVRRVYETAENIDALFAVLCDSFRSTLFMSPVSEEVHEVVNAGDSEQTTLNVKAKLNSIVAAEVLRADRLIAKVLGDSPAAEGILTRFITPGGAAPSQGFAHA